MHQREGSVPHPIVPSGAFAWRTAEGVRALRVQVGVAASRARNRLIDEVGTEANANACREVVGWNTVAVRWVQRPEPVVANARVAQLFYAARIGPLAGRAQRLVELVHVRLVDEESKLVLQAAASAGMLTILPSCGLNQRRDLLADARCDGRWATQTFQRVRLAKAVDDLLHLARLNRGQR